VSSASTLPPAPFLPGSLPLPFFLLAGSSAGACAYSYSAGSTGTQSMSCPVCCFAYKEQNGAGERHSPMYHSDRSNVFILKSVTSSGMCSDIYFTQCSKGRARIMCIGRSLTMALPGQNTAQLCTHMGKSLRSCLIMQKS